MEWMLESLEKLRDPRLEGTVLCLRQEAPGHSSTLLPSLIQHGVGCGKKDRPGVAMQDYWGERSRQVFSSGERV